MKGILVFGLVLVSLVVATVLAIPILAHGPDDGEPTRTDGETWEAMH